MVCFSDILIQALNPPHGSRHFIQVQVSITAHQSARSRHLPQIHPKLKTSPPPSPPQGGTPLNQFLPGLPRSASLANQLHSSESLIHLPWTDTAPQSLCLGLAKAPEDLLLSTKLLRVIYSPMVFIALCFLYSLLGYCLITASLYLSYFCHDYVTFYLLA